MATVAPFEVGITASDIATLLPFYQGVLGMHLISDLDVPVDKGAATGLSPSGYRIVRLETSAGDRFKLAQPRSPPASRCPAEFPMVRQGTAYVTFLVADLASLHRALVAAGTAIHSDGIVEVRPGVRLFLATDPEGNFLEFLEYDDLDAYRPSPRR